MKRIICAFLVFLMLFSVVACAIPGDTTNTTAVTTVPDASNVTSAPADTTAAAITPNLPDVTYGGIEFRIANSAYDDAKYTYSHLTSFDLTGDTLNDATYDRTITVQEKFDVKIIDEKISTNDFIVKLSANDDYYAFGTATLSNIMSIVNKGYATDMYDIPTLDLEKPWWDHNAEKKLSFNGKLYYTFSDAMIYALDNTRAIYFNKTILSEQSLDDPYKLVEDNAWTIDKMREMGVAAILDDGGDGVWNLNDRYGIINNNTTFYEAMLTGCDAEIMKQGDNGIPYFYCFDNKEMFVEVYDKLLASFSTDNVFKVAATADARTSFANGGALFMTDTLYEASVLRQLDIEFGILPMPKYNAEQENYLHVSPNPHCIVIPNADQQILDRTGILLEAMSYYSSEYYADDALIPSYYDKTLLGRAAKDEESAESLQIIHDNISYVIKIVGTSFSNAIYSYFESKSDISSLLKTQENNQKKVLESTIKSLTN